MTTTHAINTNATEALAAIATRLGLGSSHDFTNDQYIDLEVAACYLAERIVDTIMEGFRNGCPIATLDLMREMETTEGVKFPSGITAWLETTTIGSTVVRTIYAWFGSKFDPDQQSMGDSDI